MLRNLKQNRDSNSSRTRDENYSQRERDIENGFSQGEYRGSEREDNQRPTRNRNSGSAKYRDDYSKYARTGEGLGSRSPYRNEQPQRNDDEEEHESGYAYYDEDESSQTSAYSNRKGYYSDNSAPRGSYGSAYDEDEDRYLAAEDDFGRRSLRGTRNDRLENNGSYYNDKRNVRQRDDYSNSSSSASNMSIYGGGFGENGSEPRRRSRRDDQPAPQSNRINSRGASDRNRQERQPVRSEKPRRAEYNDVTDYFDDYYENNDR